MMLCTTYFLPLDIKRTQPGKKTCHGTHLSLATDDAEVNIKDEEEVSDELGGSFVDPSDPSGQDPYNPADDPLGFDPTGEDALCCCSC